MRPVIFSKNQLKELFARLQSSYYGPAHMLAMDFEALDGDIRSVLNSAGISLPEIELDKIRNSLKTIHDRKVNRHHKEMIEEDEEDLEFMKKQIEELTKYLDSKEFTQQLAEKAEPKIQILVKSAQRELEQHYKKLQKETKSKKVKHSAKAQI